MGSYRTHLNFHPFYNLCEGAFGAILRASRTIVNLSPSLCIMGLEHRKAVYPTLFPCVSFVVTFSDQISLQITPSYPCPIPPPHPPSSSILFLPPLSSFLLPPPSSLLLLLPSSSSPPLWELYVSCG